MAIIQSNRLKNLTIAIMNTITHVFCRLNDVFSIKRRNLGYQKFSYLSKHVKVFKNVYSMILILGSLVLELKRSFFEKS